MNEPGGDQRRRRVRKRHSDRVIVLLDVEEYENACHRRNVESQTDEGHAVVGLARLARITGHAVPGGR